VLLDDDGGLDALGNVVDRQNRHRRNRWHLRFDDTLLAGRPLRVDLNDRLAQIASILAELNHIARGEHSVETYETNRPDLLKELWEPWRALMDVAESINDRQHLHGLWMDAGHLLDDVDRSRWKAKVTALLQDSETVTGGAEDPDQEDEPENGTPNASP